MVPRFLGCYRFLPVNKWRTHTVFTYYVNGFGSDAAAAAPHGLQPRAPATEAWGEGVHVLPQDGSVSHASAYLRTLGSYMRV